MARILDYTGTDVTRVVTVADLIAAKARPEPFAQVTATTPDEAAAAEAAGIEMVVCMSDFVPAVREGSTEVFVTSAIDFTGTSTEDELLGVAYESLVAGADAVITARGLRSVERLTHEDIPTMGHLGFVPKKSTLYGGVRAVGKTAPEATALWEDFRRLESAGAFAVECELIPAAVMHEINQRSGLVTISLGSGPSADVMFLFMSDICGEGAHIPRHARTYVDLERLHEQVRAERRRGLREFRADVASGSYPAQAETAAIDDAELAAFITNLDR